MIMVVMLTQRTVHFVYPWRERFLTIGSLNWVNTDEIPNWIGIRVIQTEMGFCMSMFPFGYGARCRIVVERALRRDSEEIVSVTSPIEDCAEL